MISLHICSMESPSPDCGSCQAKLRSSRLRRCIVYETTALCERMYHYCIYGLTHTESWWALQRFDSKHAALCCISHVPDLHGRLATSGFVALIVDTHFLFCDGFLFLFLHNLDRRACSFLFDVDIGLTSQNAFFHLARHIHPSPKKKGLMFNLWHDGDEFESISLIWPFILHTIIMMWVYFTGV